MEYKGTTHYEFNETGKAIADYIVEEINQRGGEAWLGRTYMDHGADITWDTIIAVSQSPTLNGMTFQLLHPAEYDRMNDGTISFMEVEELIKRACDN